MNFRDSRRFGVIATLIAFFAMASTITIASPASAGKPRCTIKGTKGPDKLVGTKGRDVICGFAGNDRLIGLGGNDVLLGGPGKDLIKAGGGNDRLLGQPDNDRLFGGRGNDFLDGGRGRNQLFTGPGNNKCVDKETDTVTPGCDDTPPVITGLVADQDVDTFEAPAMVTVTLKMTDDLAGIKGTPSVELTFPQTHQRRWVDLNRIAGDNLDGIYSGTVTLPKFSPQGRWGFYVTAVDNQDNTAYANPASLDRAGFSSGVNQVGAGDQSGPEFKTFEVDRESIDTSAAAGTFNFRARVTDKVSGVALTSNFRPVEVILVNAVDPGRQIQANNMQLVSGTEFDGVWEGSITFPQGSTEDEWDLRLGAIDYADNITLVNHAELLERGLPHQIRVTNGASSDR